MSLKEDLIPAYHKIMTSQKHTRSPAIAEGPRDALC